MTQTLERPTAGPTNAVTDEQTGKRFYLFDGDETRYWSVTTALNVIDKEGLPPWAAGLAAQNAFDELPTLIAAVRIKPCGRTYYKCQHDWREPHTSLCRCRVCQTCIHKWLVDRHNVKSAERADEGKRTHYVIEWWVNSGGEWIGYDDDIAPYVAAARAFIAEFGLTPASWLLAEATVVHRADVWAGTADGIVRFEATASPAAAELVARVLTKLSGAPVTPEDAVAGRLWVDLMIDFKTQDKPVEKEKFYPNQALQLAAYRQAPVYRIKGTNLEENLPDTHAAALIHLRPDGATLRPVLADDVDYGAFLNALNLYRWLIDRGAASVSVRTFPLPKKPAKKTTPRAAATTDAPPRKRAVKAAAPATVPVSTPPEPGSARAQRLANPTRSRYFEPGNRLSDSDIPF